MFLFVGGKRGVGGGVFFAASPPMFIPSAARLVPYLAFEMEETVLKFICQFWFTTDAQAGYIYAVCFR